MADIATLGVHLEETGTAQVVAALNRVEAAVKGTHQSTVQMGASIGVASAAATAGFTAIATAAGVALGALKSLGEGTVGMNSSLEQSGIAFTTMLGSAEKAGAFLKDLQQFAATTPFEFPQLQTAAKRMLAFGFSAEEVIPTLTAVGNAAAAMGSGQEGIDRITTALGQIKAKGVVASEEILQLTEAGIPAWDMLAKKLGTDVAGAMDAVQKRTVTAQTFMDAFTQGTASRFGNMMEAQSHTFAGAMSTIRDTLGQLVGGAFKPFFDILSGLADRLAQFAQTETVSVWAEDLKITLGALGPMFNDVAGWLEGQLPAAMSAAEGAAHGFVDGVQAIQGALATVQGKAGEFLAAIAPVTDWLGQLGSQLGDVPGRVLADFGNMFDGIGRLAEQAAASWQSFMGAIGGQGTSDTAMSNIAGGIHTVLDALEALGSTAGAAFQTFQITAVEVLNVVLPKLEELGTWIGETFPPKIAALQETWDGFWSHAGPLVTAFWGVVQPILGVAIGVELGILQAALTTFKDVWDFVWGGIMAAIEKVAPLIGALASTFGGAFAGLSDTLTAALASLQTPVAEAATEVGTTIKNNIVQGVAPAATEVEQAVAPAAEAITKVGTTATAAAPAVASLGTAGTTAAAGLSTTTAAAQTLDQVMSQLAKATTPEAVEQALLWQNANTAIAEAMKSLDLETAAQVQAMKNAGDVYGAARVALTALGATGDEVTSTIHGLASAHDVLAEAAYRATAGLRAEQAAAIAAAAVGPSASGSAMGAPANNTNVPAVANGWQAMADRILGGTMHVQISDYSAEALSQMSAVSAQLARNASTNSSANGGVDFGVGGFNARIDPLLGPYLQRHPEAETEVANRLGGPDVAHGLASPDPQAYYQELTRLAEQENEVIASQQEATKATDQHTQATQVATRTTGELANEQMGYSTAIDTSQNVWIDYMAGTGLATHHVHELAQGFLTTADATREAARAFSESAAQVWASAKATAEALAANQLLIAGFKTQVGLTYGQIYGNTGTNNGGSGGSGGSAGGSNQGMTNLPPGNYYGIPVVSPITGGTLRGYADGGWVTEPVMGRGMRSGAPYAFGENGPEYVSPGGGGGTSITIQINASGVDALRDDGFWDQAVSRQIRPALKRVGVKV